MAKFRTGHVRKRSRQSGGLIARVGIFLLIILVFYAILRQSFFGPGSPGPVEVDVPDLEVTGVDSIFFLPSSTTNQIVRHKYFALSYKEDFELAEWVAYELTADRLEIPWVPRTNDFRVDHKITTGSSSPQDYRRSSFQRGHLAAAADMAFSPESMSESFFMSNIAPQRPGFNQGVWRELEELTRDWAKRDRHLYVVTGPVLEKDPALRIGENRVAVPEAFYRILLDLHEPGRKAIAFVIPNETTEKRLEEFATAVDTVEAMTGIDFFGNLLPEDLEKELEAGYDTGLWETDERKYRLRVNKWNLKQ